MQPQQSTKDRGLLGRLCAGDKKLEGKTFYLDNVKKRTTTLLLEAICLLGGKVESFLHKDVTFVVTGNQDGLKEKSVAAKGEEKGADEGGQHLMKKPDGGLSRDKQRPGTPRIACSSRGKALLEKAICNNERQQRSSVLSNARSWGVKILYADDVLLYLKHLTRESFSAKPKRSESSTKQNLPAVKATALRVPYLKIEDVNRKYKPLHMQSVAFPSLYFLGRFSPFESPPPPLFEQDAGQRKAKTREKKVENSFQGKCPTPLSCNPSPWRPRRKDTSYCECCSETFTDLEEHLLSDKHRSFVLDPSNYKAVDQLVAEMLPGFDPNPAQQSEQRPPTPLPMHGDCELELCTDAEVEDAVLVLRRDDSSFSARIPNPASSPPSCNPPSPSEELKFTSQNVTSQLTDSESLHTDAHHHTTHGPPQLSSPTMPVLTMEPLSLQLETAFPDAPCLLPDPYSLPPVLSPQLPDRQSITDPHSAYSEPPILSPQKYNSEETWGEQISKMNIEDSESALLLSTILPASLTGTSLEQEVGLKCPTGSLSRSSSFPRLSVASPNPKKRCRSDSPEHRSSKRRKKGKETGGCCEQSHSSSKTQSDNTADFVDCLLYGDPYPVRQPCAQKALKQAYQFSVSAFQSFQMDPAADPPPCSLPSKAANLNYFPVDNGKTQRAISGQDSQRSRSLSTSVCIEPALIPDLAGRSLESSDSDWDCDLLSRLGPTSAAPPAAGEQSCELDKELLHRPCPWMRNSSYESHLHTVLQPSAPAAVVLCGEDVDSATFSRTVVQIVQVQH